MILRLPIPLGPRSSTVAPDSHRVTSMCMEIAGFSHEDCPGGYCACKCHADRERTARLRAAREKAQDDFDRALPKLGTVNRLRSQWVNGFEFYLPHHDSPGE